MEMKQYRAAGKLLEEKQAINKELRIWKDQLTSPKKLGYLQEWNSAHPAELNSAVPDAVFQGFREVAISCLELRILEIDAEFEKL